MLDLQGAPNKQMAEWNLSDILARSLGEIGNKSAAGSVMAAMERHCHYDSCRHNGVYNNENGPNVEMTAKALARLGDKQAVEPLIKVVRIYPEAAVGLAMVGDKRAIGQLQITAGWARDTASWLFGSPSMKVAQALFDLDPQSCVDAAARILHGDRDYETCQPQLEALRLLAKVGNAKAIECIRLALRDQEPSIRREARESLVKLRASATTSPASGPAPRVTH
jgi:HEAT repeat protein